MNLESNTAETILWNHIPGERLAVKRVRDDDRSIQRQQLREVSVPHLFRGHIAQIEGVAGNSFAIPQGVQEGFVLDDGARAADVEGMVNDLGLFILEEVAGP